MGINLSFIKKAMPWIGTVIGTAVPAAAPFVGIASKLLSSGLGTKVDATTESITNAIQEALGDPTKLAALKQIDNDFAIQMKTLEINSAEEFEKMATADRADARAMQVKTGSRLPAILAVSITVGFFSLLMLTAFRAVPEANAKVIDVMIGSLGAAWLAIVNYYFGSSSGSARKTELLSMASPVDTTPATTG